MPPELCPNCGTEVPAGAKACPECGSDEQTGWSDEADRGALGLPEDSFDYAEFTRREFGPTRSPDLTGIKLFWRVIAAVLVAGFIYFLLRRWL